MQTVCISPAEADLQKAIENSKNTIAILKYLQETLGTETPMCRETYADWQRKIDINECLLRSLINVLQESKAKLGRVEMLVVNSKQPNVEIARPILVIG